MNPIISTSRRGFLKGGAKAGVALSALSLASRAAPVESSGPDLPQGMRLAIATICLDGFGPENFEPTFRMLPQTGFQNVEFNCWYPGSLTPRGLASICDRCDAIGVRPISVQGSAFRDGKVQDVSHKLWCLQAARTLGCSRVKFTGSKRGTQGGLPAVIDCLRELAPAAEEMGILVCVENHANNNLETIADYETLFESIDSPNVGLCLDTGHFDGAGVRIPEVIERFHARINHVDLKDCASFGTYRTVPFGSGITDLHGTIVALKEKGYRGYLVVEQAPPLNPDTLEADMRAAYERFQPYEG